MSLNAASESARNASRSTTSISLPPIVSTRTPLLATPGTSSLRYWVSSLPSGNSGVCLYGGSGVEGGGEGAFIFASINRRRKFLNYAVVKFTTRGLLSHAPPLLEKESN